MVRAAGRTQDCSIAEARRRLAHARKFLDATTFIADDRNDYGDPEFASAAASLAVLAGIAASDAACCKALGLRPRGQDHREAGRLVAQIVPGGRPAAHSLRRLLDLKDEAHYGFYDVSGPHLVRALREAATFVAFAEDVLRR